MLIVPPTTFSTIFPLNHGVTSVAIVFIHSYTFPDHELEMARLCESLGYTHVSSSSQLTPTVKAVARGHTATVNAFLTPYLEVDQTYMLLLVIGIY